MTNWTCDPAAGPKVTKGLNLRLNLQPVFKSVVTTVLFCLFIQKTIFCSVLIHVAAQRFESMMSSVRRRRRESNRSCLAWKRRRGHRCVSVGALLQRLLPSETEITQVSTQSSGDHTHSTSTAWRFIFVPSFFSNCVVCVVVYRFFLWWRSNLYFTRRTRGENHGL